MSPLLASLASNDVFVFVNLTGALHTAGPCGTYRIVNLYRRKRDGSLVIIKEIPVEEMTLEERQGALTEVKVRTALGMFVPPLSWP